MRNQYGLFEPRDNPYHRLYPLTKLVIALFCAIGALLLPGIGPAYLAFLFIIVPLAVVAQVVGPLLSRTLKVLLPFAISVFLIQGLFWTDGTPVLDLGLVSFKAEGLAFAARSTGRILMLISSFLLLSLTTRPDHLMVGLTQAGVPDKLAFIMLSTIQLIPRFQDKADTIFDAQRSRGLETCGGIRQRVRALVPLVEPLILGSLVDVEERAIALEARGFGRKNPKTALLVLDDRGWERALRWSLVVVWVALAGASIFLW